MLLESYLRSALRPPSMAVIVAHPDDETLWAGGQILAHPECRWEIVTLCRGSDPDRAPKFRRVLEHLGATGAMADLDDGPEQEPLAEAEVQDAILSLLSGTAFDGILTHGPEGEYTRHRRHEEVSRAVAGLWRSGRLTARRLCLFAYEDGGRAYLPQPRKDAHRVETLPESIWQRKHGIIRDIYGFSEESWEARTTPREEAFWCFESPAVIAAWLKEKGLR
jgi:LmbE family N-acetylglucosaminyl deacetylase